jgi:hypothetical protein
MDDALPRSPLAQLVRRLPHRAASSAAALAGAALTRLAAADGPFDQVLPGGRVDPDAWRPNDLLHPHGLAPVMGLVLLGVALIPLTVGWRFLRLTLSLLLGCYLALWTWQFGMPLLHQLWPHAELHALQPALVVATALALVIGLLLGWFVFQLEMALSGAALGALVLALPGMVLGSQLLSWSLALVGAVIGFLAGWIVAPYWAAIQTSILGGALVVQGVAVLAQDSLGGSQLALVAYGLGIVAGVLGAMVQISGIHKRKERFAGPRAMAGGRAAS